MMGRPPSRLTGPPDRREDRTLGAALAAAVTRFGGDRPAFVFDADGSVLTFGELERDSRALAGAFLAAGLGPGDRVAVFGEGHRCWPIAIFAAARAQLVVCGLNTKYRRHELDYVLASADPAAVVLAAADRDGYLVEHLAVSTTSEDLAADPLVVLTRRRHRDRVALSQLVRDDVRFGGTARARPSDEALIQFTSGSTAAPKGVVLSQAAMVRLAQNLADAAGFDERDVIFSPMPFYHIGGTINTAVAAVVSGATMVVSGRFEPGRGLAAVARHRCTGHVGHEAVFAMELDHPERSRWDLSSLRKGWAVGPPALLRRIHDELGVTDVVQGYGMSEGGTATCGRPGDPLDKRLTTSGRPLPGNEVELRDDEGTVVPWGDIGEIYYRSPALMTRYWNDPEATKATLDAEGWLRTGDLGIIDDDGFLQLVGRRKDMIKSGGENVSALEVESFLITHPGIQHAAVFGLPDPVFGEITAAAVSAVPGVPLTEETVRAHALSGLATFKVPRRIWVVEEMPITATGKVHKSMLRRLLEVP